MTITTEMIPLHPVLVHFPIAFFILELILLALWRIKKDEDYLKFAKIVFTFGYAVLFLVLITGYFDAGGTVPALFRAVRNHFFSATALFVFYTARAVLWRRLRRGSPYFAAVHLWGAALGSLIVVVTGYFGGHLVYGA